MMNRRGLLRAAPAGLLLWSVRAPGQQPARMPVIGLLITHPPVTDPVVEAVRTGLRAYGYRDGENIRLEVRTALGQLDRVPALADELLKLKVDVIVLANEVALRAVTRLTKTIPVVMSGYTDDPAAIGWIENYRHPGGNVTGVFTVNSALTAKRLELVRETLPNAAHIAVVFDPTFGKRQLSEVQRVSPTLGVRASPIEVAGSDRLRDAFDQAKRLRVAAVLLVWSPLFYVNTDRIAALGIETRMPIFTDVNTFVEAGGLLSYGSAGLASFERVGYYVDRLLKGTKAADLPVEQMTNIKLVVNLKTARAIGVKIPESVLVRADQILQ
jgi:putative ABC transport system substrate-binding protein